jgi:hypothetical protein
MSGEHGRVGTLRVRGQKSRFIQHKSTEARAKTAEAAAAAVHAGTDCAPLAAPSERLHRKLEDAKKSMAP